MHALSKWGGKSDSELRPWTKNDDLEEKIGDEESKLQDTITRTSGSRLAGAVGSSMLDKKPQALIDLEVLMKAVDDGELEIVDDEPVPQSCSDDGDGGGGGGGGDGCEGRLSWAADTEGASTGASASASDNDFDLGEGGDGDGDGDGLGPLHSPIRYGPRHGYRATRPPPPKGLNPLGAVGYSRRKGPAVVSMGAGRYKTLEQALTDHQDLLFRGHPMGPGGPSKADVLRALQILPKAFSGKTIKALSDTVMLASTLQVQGQHKGEGVFSTAQRQCNLGSVQEGPPPVHTKKARKRGSAEPSKKLAGPRIAGGKALSGVGADHASDGDAGDYSMGGTTTASGDTVLVPRVGRWQSTCKTPLDEILERYARPTNVGTHILHSARREEEVGADGKKRPQRITASSVGQVVGLAVQALGANSAKVLEASAAAMGNNRQAAAAAEAQASAQPKTISVGPPNAKVQLEPLKLGALSSADQPPSPVQSTKQAPQEREIVPRPATTGGNSGSSPGRGFFLTMLTAEDPVSNRELSTARERLKQLEQLEQQRVMTGGRMPSARLGSAASAPALRAVNNSHCNSNPNNAGSLPPTPKGQLSSRGAASARGIAAGALSSRAALVGPDGENYHGQATRPARGGEVFSHKKIQEVRTLKDQLMTVTGGDALNARLLMIEATNALMHDNADSGGDPEFYETIRRSTGKNIRANNKANRATVMKMVHETKLKNIVDQTWPCFETPGFMDVVGPEEVFQSHTQRAFSPPGSRVASLANTRAESASALHGKTKPLRANYALLHSQNSKMCT